MFVATVHDNSGVILTDNETGKVIKVTFARVKNKKRLYIECDKSIHIQITKPPEEDASNKET